MTDLIALDDNSRVWIYQADSFFTENEMHNVINEIQQFITNWASHRVELRAYGNLFHQRFIAFFVDESHSPASGCSIDDSVRFLQSLGKKYNKNLIEREHFPYIIDNQIHFVHMNELKALYDKGIVSDDTLFFDHLVKTKSEFINSWLKPLAHSFHKRFI